MGAKECSSCRPRARNTRRGALPMARAAATAVGAVSHLSPASGFQAERTNEANATPARAHATTALAEMRGAYGWVASITASIACSSIYRARPSAPPKPPIRVAMGCELGAAVRPANDRVASKRGSPARSLANAEASVVPPRMRTRMTDTERSTGARWLSIVGIGEDGVQGLSPVAQKLLASAELVVGGKR